MKKIKMVTLNGNTRQQRPSGGTFSAPNPPTSDHGERCILTKLFNIIIMTITMTMIMTIPSNQIQIIIMMGMRMYFRKFEHVTWSSRVNDQCTVYTVRMLLLIKMMTLPVISLVFLKYGNYEEGEIH